VAAQKGNRAVAAAGVAAQVAPAGPAGTPAEPAARPVEPASRPAEPVSPTGPITEPRKTQPQDVTQPETLVPDDRTDPGKADDRKGTQDTQ